MFQKYFLTSVANYASNELALALWRKIEKHYGESNRHYHTLTHLDNLVQQLEPHQHQFDTWDTIIFAIAYHDVIYNSLKSNNEEKSAVFAEKALRTTTFPETEIERCKKLIQATKKHEPVDHQTNLFTDADLSILGAPNEVYQNYMRQIRKEYKLYPDMLYNPGRRKVLEHFLSMKSIYKTNIFHEQYEAQARINIESELTELS
jgi:predicted metal-dependent HD superfamily phosphohydrolase